MVKNEDVEIMTYKGIEIDGKPTLELLKSIFAGDFTSATAIGCYEYWESKKWLTKKGAELKTLETAISVYKSVANKKLQKEEKKRRIERAKAKNEARKRYASAKDKSRNYSKPAKKESTEYEAWTDGSCFTFSKHRAGGSAYVVIKDGVKVHEAKFGCKGTTNNRMEMLAIISAANWIPKDSSITIYSDSMYAINVLSEKWKAKTNTDLVRLYKTVAARLTKVKLKWVKGHSGNGYNEYVDSIASSESTRVLEECKNNDK